MDRVAKRYLISGAIGIVSMLAALAYALLEASEKVDRADDVVRPAFSIDTSDASVMPYPPLNVLQWKRSCHARSVSGGIGAAAHKRS